MARKADRKRKRRRIRWDIETFCVLVFVAGFVFYGFAKIGLNSYNITLQQKEQKLANEILQKKNEVEDLQAEVHSMQDKGRVLNLLGDQVQDNSGNIYLIGKTE